MGLSTRDLGSESDADFDSKTTLPAHSLNLDPRLRAVLRDSACNRMREFLQSGSAMCIVNMPCGAHANHIESGSGIRIQWIRFQYLCREPQYLVYINISFWLLLIGSKILTKNPRLFLFPCMMAFFSHGTQSGDYRITQKLIICYVVFLVSFNWF